MTMNHPDAFLPLANSLVIGGGVVTVATVWLAYGAPATQLPLPAQVATHMLLMVVPGVFKIGCVIRLAALHAKREQQAGAGSSIAIG
ncbi:hypothetical protein [Chitinivorax sp. B]|uniref:hypothetical protein n=1 Tax=Chitinivorax sp. B TaxID=2502235 RepID=UPI0010F5E862|nr:hypothetical protein [Chitinivorax sp. B]